MAMRGAGPRGREEGLQTAHAAAVQTGGASSPLGVIDVKAIALILAVALAASLLLDYIHVRIMCIGCPYPTPMSAVFFAIFSMLGFSLYLTLRRPPNEGEAGRSVDARILASLLREPERSMYLKLVDHGGEAFVAQIAKELGLNKVKAWRAAQRLQEKGLVELEKIKGRLVMRLRSSDLPPEPKYEQHQKRYK